MENPLIPKWILDEQSRRDSEQARADADRSREKTARTLVKTNGTEFGTDVLRRLKVATAEMSRLGMSGSVNPVGSAFRICLNKSGSVARFTHTDLFLESFGIRCNVFAGGSYELRYCVISDSEIAVIGDAEPINAEQAAEFIMRLMIQRLDNPNAIYTL